MVISCMSNTPINLRNPKEDALAETSVPPKTLRALKETFSGTHKKFADCVSQLQLTPEEKERFEFVVQDWHNKLDDDSWYIDLSPVSGLQSLLGFGSAFSPKLNFSQVMECVGQNFAEIGCAIHLLRELRGGRIEKVLGDKTISRCDFRVTDHISLQGKPLLVEVKYINKFTYPNVAKYLRKSISQLESSSQETPDSRKAVWIMTYDRKVFGQKAQDIVEGVQKGFPKQYQYSLSVQVYSCAVYGDCVFVV